MKKLFKSRKALATGAAIPSPENHIHQGTVHPIPADSFGQKLQAILRNNNGF